MFSHTNGARHSRCARQYGCLQPAGCVQLLSSAHLRHAPVQNSASGRYVVPSLGESCLAIEAQRLHHIRKSDEPARARVLWRGCCRHKVVDRLLLAGDHDALISTTCSWHLRKAECWRRTWLRLRWTSALCLADLPRNNNDVALTHSITIMGNDTAKSSQWMWCRESSLWPEKLELW